MLYCFNCKNSEYNNFFSKEMEKAKEMNAFIYYDKDKALFLDQNDKKVDVKNKDILPISENTQLKEIIEALISSAANIPNDIESINKINKWYDYIIYRREVVSFTGAMLDDITFLNKMKKIFSRHKECFLKTKNGDFNTIIQLSDIFDPNSALRETFSYHKDDEFILADKINIDKDELGEIKYRSFIYNGQIMNISRQVENTYHKVPEEVLIYIKAILNNLPTSFPKTFAFDVFSYNNNILDVLKLAPIETSKSYLYNSFFESTNDLLHEDETIIPSEKKNNNLSHDYFEELVQSPIAKTKTKFEEDYNNIKKLRTNISREKSSNTTNELSDELEQYPDLISLFAKSLSEKQSTTPKDTKDLKQLTKVLKKNN